MTIKTTKSQERISFFWPIAWLTLIYLTSTTVVTRSQLTSGVTQVLPVRPEKFEAFWLACWWLIVKGWHAFAFGFLFWLLLRVLGEERTRVVLILVASCAVIDEVHQVFVKYRGGRLSDVCIDFIGIGVAWYLTTGRHRYPFSALAQIFAIGFIIAAIALLSFFPFGDLEPLFGAAR